ncbi:MAG: hypothetical protein HYR96_15250 [Deltaproteobacteria bacterium]|nr:hypothetical protein [Deltaproteobacteria bacterium]MBI3296250.1 hypothetical protein [Deltaproteobacteria bacterium]
MNALRSRDWEVLFLVALFALSGCFEKEKPVALGSSPGASVADPNFFDSGHLQGRWEGHCVSDEEGNHMNILLTFSGDTYSGAFESFADAACTQSYSGMAQTMPSARYTLGADIPNQPGVKEINFVMDGGFTFYSIIRIEGSRLTMGKESGEKNGIDASNRHTRLNSFFLVRQ